MLPRAFPPLSLCAPPALPGKGSAPLRKDTGLRGAWLLCPHPQPLLSNSSPSQPHKAATGKIWGPGVAHGRKSWVPPTSNKTKETHTHWPRVCLVVLGGWAAPAPDSCLECTCPSRPADTAVGGLLLRTPPGPTLQTPEEATGVARPRSGSLGWDLWKTPGASGAWPGGWRSTAPQFASKFLGPWHRKSLPERGGSYSFSPTTRHHPCLGPDSRGRNRGGISGREQGSLSAHPGSHLCALLGLVPGQQPLQGGSPRRPSRCTPPLGDPISSRCPAGSRPRPPRPTPREARLSRTKHTRSWESSIPPHASLTWIPNSGPGAPHPPDPGLGLEGAQDETLGRPLGSAPGTGAGAGSAEDEGAGTRPERPRPSAGAVPGRCPRPASPGAADWDPTTPVRRRGVS